MMADAPLLVGMDGKVRQAKDGRILPVSISTSVITDSRGTPQGVVLVGRDLTERKKAEEELRRFRDRLEELVEKRTGELDQVNRRLQQEITDHVRATGALAESEERFRSLFENSTIGLYRTTSDGRILLANPTLVRMLGYESLEDLIRRNLEEDGFEAGYPRSGFKEQIEAEGEIRGLESAWKRRDGTPVFVRESAKAIRDAAGNVLYYEGTVEDISDRRKAEDALRASLREKEVLFREIHHRVKNNMQIISSLLSLQAREIDDPAIVEMFRESQSRIRSMAFVHEKLYQSKDLSQIGFSDYIRSLTKGGKGPRGEIGWDTSLWDKESALNVHNHDGMFDFSRRLWYFSIDQ